MPGNLLHIRNVKKTLHYLKKNGLKYTYYAARERAGQELSANYQYSPVADSELKRQRSAVQAYPYKFSILVPAYETPPRYLKEMLESVLQQSYDKLELIIADAGTGEIVREIVEEYQKRDQRIRYLRLKENKGISANTNKALQYVSGDYVGLLDHDDILTPDALYEVAAAIDTYEQNKITVEMIYSDEDKCDGSTRKFFDVNRKDELNLDLILSNNYICHFLVMKKELIQTLELRSAYDGAQDYDLVLRAIHRIWGKPLPKTAEERSHDLQRLKESVVHIPKVLYHWRCHDDSTAANPQSKEYAYEAGKRAIEDFIRKRGWNGSVVHTRHLGFYRVEYQTDIFQARPEIGIIGGRLINRKNKIAGGIYSAGGETLFAGLPREYSGYMHRASLRQEAAAVDIRCMKVAPQLEELLEEVIGLPYLKNPRNGRFYWKECLKKEADFKRISRQLCQKVKAAGYLIVWDPEMSEKIN